MAKHPQGWRALTLHLHKSDWFPFLCMDPNSLSPNPALTPACSMWGRAGDWLENCSAALGPNVNIKTAFVLIYLLSFLLFLFVLLVGKTDLTEGWLCDHKLVNFGLLVGWLRGAPMREVTLREF